MAQENDSSKKLEVTEKLTQRVAHLARLNLSEDELKTFTAQLGDILGYVEQLGKVNLQVDGKMVEPMVHPFDLPTEMRADVAESSPVDEKGKPKSLSSAPEILGGGFKVPPIL